MTANPFGVNITLLPAISPPDYVGYAKVIVEEGICIVETAGNNPRPVIEVLRKAPFKIYILHKYLITTEAADGIQMHLNPARAFS